MVEMLALMDGMEIRANHGSFFVVGPKVCRSSMENGVATYRVVFLRDSHHPFRPFDGPRSRRSVLLNGIFHIAPNYDDMPLLNRLDINDTNGHDDNEPNGYGNYPDAIYADDIRADDIRPEDIYPEDIYPDDIYPEDIYPEDIYPEDPDRPDH